MQTSPLPRRPALGWLAPAMVLGCLACSTSTSGETSVAKTDAAAPSTTGGGGGTTAGSSGGNTGTGGLAGATGGNGTGGSSMGSGGKTIGTGGTPGGSGGNRSDGGPVATGGTPDAGLEKDSGANAGADATDGKDVAQDTPIDQRIADASPSPASGDGGIAVPDGYKLVWSDEFNTDGTPDPKNWNYEKGFQRNNELQWYQANNATVKDGVLTIEGRKERVTNPNYSASGSDWKTTRQYADYTSTSMTTSGLQTWQYGRFEMRARIPTSAGMWPAWWTLGVGGEWPSNGEIDIMEFYKGNVLANVACGTATRWTAKWDGSSKAISSLGANWASNFHIWRMDWDDQNINLYLDDTLLNGVPLSTMLNSDGTSPFKQKVYMLVNLAIGGDNGGDPSGTTFPVKYEVDYVRVFQKL